MEDSERLDKRPLFSLFLGGGRRVRLQYHSKLQSLTISELIKRAIDKYLDELDVKYDDYLRKLEERRKDESR